jgi:hypothetical protein
MNRNLSALLVVALLPSYACDSKSDPITKGRESVKGVVTQPFHTLEATKESLDKSEQKTKAALEEFEKENKQP